MNNLIRGNVFDAKVVLGMTIDEANTFVAQNIVYCELNDTCTEDQKITQVCDKGYKDLRIDPGNIRLRVTINPYGNITEINGLG